MSAEADICCYCRMTDQDIPEVFGLHKNADISYQINTAKVRAGISRCHTLVIFLFFFPSILFMVVMLVWLDVWHIAY